MILSGIEIPVRTVQVNSVSLQMFSNLNRMEWFNILGVKAWRGVNDWKDKILIITCSLRTEEEALNRTKKAKR